MDWGLVVTLALVAVGQAVSGSREKCLTSVSDYCVKFSFCVCGVGGRLNFAQHLFA